ncbi:ABC transporter substrate-binding protein [Pseudodonghicola flavimaris]|uniref:ABC transporter substrate-binding protein n=1 Tax=Pseudodonghicola flavimaris TaxID=3050036 RepID=A0ABT7EXJ3_9RHOB|nr:ABC transporter substrate-binding protein [Pseudodonghicola flavimaris]MDK3017064.1 ABC transporter substrate-binding protein [Pseudodonghicola flavimaris]
MTTFNRRDILQLLGIGTAGAMLPARAVLAATGKDTVTMAWPSDVPSWDPNKRFSPDAQSLFKLVFDQPILQAPDLTLIPSLMTEWELAADGLSLRFALRDDVSFHDGTPMTAEDVRFSFFERLQSGEKLDIGNSWKHITDIEVTSPTSGVFRFSRPAPTAPEWLAFMGSFVVPKAYMEKVGSEAFRDAPVGTGPYKLVDYQMNSRMVFEANDAYWGGAPEIKKITVDVIKDASARVAAVQSGQADLTINIPVRETERLDKIYGITGEINPITRVILLQMRNDGEFASDNLRLAAHHAINKAALSKAFYGGAAVPLSVVAPPGTPGDVAGYDFAYDPEKARALLAEAGFSADNPARFKMATTNGHFPSDFDIARALLQMWKKVGIEVELEVIEYAKYFELNRGHKLPAATLYSWDNATGDPEIFTGYLLNPNMPFSSWKGEQPGDQIPALFQQPDYDKRIAGYQKLNREATEMGATIPLLQSVQTLARKSDLSYLKFQNGWVLGNTMSWG